MNTSHPVRAGRREWIGLAILMLPTILIALDTTVLHLAVPHLSTELQPTGTQLLWIVDIYGFVIAGLLMTMGTLGDRIGRRRLLLTGAGAFGIASVVAAFSPNADMLIISRALLGVAGATLMPSTMSLIRNMFLDPHQRTVAIGIWVSGFSVGSAIGPLFGGLLLEHFWWGSVFLLGVPVMLVLIVAGRALLPEYRDPNPGRFDLLSAAMSLVGALTIIYGLKQIAQEGLDWLPVLAIVVGLATGALFIQRQRRLADPLIDLRLFHVPAFSASLVTYMLGIFVNFGIFLFIAQYLQLVIGLSPLQAGLWALPGAITSVIGSNAAPALARRFRPAAVITAGLVFAAIGIGMFTQVGMNSLALVVVGWVVTSLGFGFAFTLSADLVVGTAPPERAGAASAISETSLEFGGALGIALLGSIGMAVYRGQVAAALAPVDLPAEMLKTVQETLGSATDVAAQLGEPLGTAVLGAADLAFVHGLQVIAVIGTIILIGLALLSTALLRHLPAPARLAARPAAEPVVGASPALPGSQAAD